MKQMQCDPEVAVGVPRRPRLAKDFDADAEFFPDLAPRRLRWSLASFHLSTGEFPQPTEQALLGPPCDHKPRTSPHEGSGDVVMRQRGTLAGGRSKGNGSAPVSEA